MDCLVSGPNYHLDCRAGLWVPRCRPRQCLGRSIEEFLIRLVRTQYLKSGSQGPIPASVCRIRLGELPRVLERDDAAATVVFGVDVTDHTDGKHDLVAVGSFHRLV